MLLEKLVIPIGFDTGMLMAGIDAITGLITGAIDRTKEWTDGMDALGDVTGMSTDKLAAWSFVAQKAGVDIDTLSNATVIMSKGLLDSKGELSTTGKALEDFGISVLDSTGKVRDSSDLMNDISKKYAEFATQTEKVDFLTNIFGRSGASLVDVFDTMAAEGGIDKVKDKVEALGLVLDPTQYEAFQRNLSEVDLTFTGLANAFTGPLLPGAQSLLQTFTDWIQSPWIADGIANIGEKLGTLASDIALGINTGNWDVFFDDFQKFTGFDIQPLIENLGKFTAWVTDEGIPKFQGFIESVKTGFQEFKDSTGTETTAISTHWSDLLTSISDLMEEAFGTKGMNLVIDWKAVGVTALQLLDILIIGLTGSIQMMTDALDIAKKKFAELTDGAKYVESLIPTINIPTPGIRIPGRASGGSASGLTWVGERGPELVNLPSGSQVNNNQASQNMGFDYYKLAAILAVEFAKARD